MGSMVAAARAVVGVSDKKEIKERLDLLLLAAKAKIREYREEINQQFLNPAAVEKLQIPGIRAIRFIEQYHVASQSGFNEQVSGHLDKAIDAFFSIGGKDQDTKQAVQSGIKSLISTGLSAFIGSTEAGESEEKIYVVVPESNAFVRADIYAWRYNLSDNALGANTDTATAYVLCKSVIDHTKLTIDELIYLVSESLANRHEIPTIMRDMPGADGKMEPRRFYLDPSTPGQGLLRPGTPKELAADPANWVEYLDGASAGEPPAVALVEAYIDELMRVWRKLKDQNER